MSGATFTLSNLGMFEVSSFAAIIPPPQVAILATGRAVRRPVIEDEAVGVRSVMTATLSADHRAVDGAQAARFLGTFRERLAGVVDEALALL
jgi:pyruvate dehydrogenase E2 component (dihydrolipoamide acetyltransferase)